MKAVILSISALCLAAAPSGVQAQSTPSDDSIQTVAMMMFHGYGPNPYKYHFQSKTCRTCKTEYRHTINISKIDNCNYKFDISIFQTVYESPIPTTDKTSNRSVTVDFSKTYLSQIITPNSDEEIARFFDKMLPPADDLITTQAFQLKQEPNSPPEAEIFGRLTFRNKHLFLDLQRMQSAYKYFQEKYCKGIPY